MTWIFSDSCMLYLYILSCRKLTWWFHFCLDNIFIFQIRNRFYFYTVCGRCVWNRDVIYLRHILNIRSKQIVRLQLWLMNNWHRIAIQLYIKLYKSNLEINIVRLMELDFLNRMFLQAGTNLLCAIVPWHIDSCMQEIKMRHILHIS